MAGDVRRPGYMGVVRVRACLCDFWVAIGGMMTPDEFEETLANLVIGYYGDTEKMRRFVAEVHRLRTELLQTQTERDRLALELRNLREMVDKLADGLRGEKWQ